MPPFHKVNHEINLIDPDKRIHYQLPKCPDTLKEELAENISQYTSAGWWVPATVRQAILMLCVLKKNSKLRTVFNLRQQNNNTEKDISPFPDQDTICHHVACAPYRSKLYMSEAYEQIRMRPEDIPKTAFTTIFGTFVSLVMQQGDCNTPSTFQWLMTTVFREYITRFVHVFFFLNLLSCGADPILDITYKPETPPAGAPYSRPMPKYLPLDAHCIADGPSPPVTWLPCSCL